MRFHTELHWGRSVSLLALTTFALSAPVNAQQPAASAAPAGKAVYDKWCSGCHGVDGKGAGDGATHMLPRPRDFTRGVYQIRSTPNSELPTDADLKHIIDEGMPGTAMPGWKNSLSDDERNQLVAYIKTFSRFFAQQKEPLKPIEIGRAPGSSEERLKSGQEFYNRIECWKCHGRAGRGNGQSAPTQEDDYKNPIRPADLTENWQFNGGGTVEDIYRRMRTGVDGTPMPSFSDLLVQNPPFLSEDQLWNVALYVRSLSPEQTPQVRDVVRASERQGALPTAPADSAWNQAERFYIPLAGQIVVKPRWFAPSVDGVWVQALHNGTELAVRVTWNDPSRSPDPEWNEWQARVQGFMEPHEDGAAPAAAAPAPAATPATGNAAAAPAAAVAVTPLPDALVVQFPVTIPTGMERPYFLMGTASKPTYLWHWQSDSNAATELRGKGFARTETLSGGQLSGTSSFDDGQWSVVFRRPLVASDSTGRINFRTGIAIPMAVFAWDGNNGETGTKAAISTWYYIYLDQKTPSTVFATPIATIALTAGLGMLFVRRAQKRKNGNGE